MPNRACVEVPILAKKLLLVDFMPFALNKTVSIDYVHKVIPGKWSTCTMTWLITLPKTVVYVIHAKPCICWSVLFGKTAIVWVDFLPLAVYKTISIHFLHKVILEKWSTCTIRSLRTLTLTVAYIIYAEGTRIGRA